jgi:rubrerythrin
LSETNNQKKKKKRRQTLIEIEKGESELLPELVDALSELEEQRKYVDIQVCPNCKSPRVRRVKSLSGDMSAHMGMTPPKYECPECGWREHMVLKATNKPTNVRDVAIMAESKEANRKKSD